MQNKKVFSKQQLVLIIFVSFILLFISLFIQYKYQINQKEQYFAKKVENEVKKSIEKEIFEIEASITSLVSFYQASDEFTTSTFGYISKDLIKHYPIIENIIYSKLIFKEDEKQFYKDMYNNGFFNYKIQSTHKNEYFLPITNIAPDSYKYSKYYGFDILNNNNDKDFFKNLTLFANINYTHEKLLPINENLLYLVKATYYGTTIPTKNTREEQIDGYFILGINLESILSSLKDEFSQYSFSLKKKELPVFDEEVIFLNKKTITLPITHKEDIFVYYPLYLKDLNLVKMLINSFLLLLFISIITYIFYIYKKHLLYKEFSQEQIHNSEKMASLGQMIGNISHQWRQPLSAISMMASSIQVKNELSILDNNDLDKGMKDIIQKTEYLSETINIFRDFIKEEKDLQEVFLEDRIKQSMSIVGLVLMDNNINVKDNIDYKNKIKLKMVVGELDQVIINIINNAKDALIDNKIKNPIIELNLIKESNKVVISIEDNAGGIDENIFSKIFDPYFTTKHQSQGTGLGLHMSYRIVTESLKGNLYAINTNKGAKFFIELPLS